MFTADYLRKDCDWFVLRHMTRGDNVTLTVWWLKIKFHVNEGERAEDLQWMKSKRHHMILSFIIIFPSVTPPPSCVTKQTRPSSCLELLRNLTSSSQHGRPSASFMLQHYSFFSYTFHVSHVTCGSCDRSLIQELKKATVVSLPADWRVSFLTSRSLLSIVECHSIKKSHNWSKTWISK